MAAAASFPAPSGGGPGHGAASSVERQSAVEIFRQTWDVYTKVVMADYMSHVLLSDDLSADMLARHKARFTMIDIGCGGADALAAMFRKTPELAARVASYTGVDLSDIALAHARANLLGGPVAGFPDVRRAAPERGALPADAAAVFCKRDMVAFAKEAMPAGSADVVLAAFSLHHLSPEGKEAVLAAAARALKPGGSFYYLDVWMREASEEETREAYLARYKSLLDGWGSLTAEEREHIWAHVSAYDFPCAESEVAASPYFGRCEALARDGGPHALLRLTEPVVVSSSS